MSIVGRGANCKGGKSAVEQSAYISRTTMESTYYQQTFYPKYSEDLVHDEIMLPPQAPREYSDRKILWNAVEAVEKHAKAQLARTYKVSLPNSWSYELAKDVMRDYVERNFVSKGMCAEFAIHDSMNEKTGQRNLHCHIMLTMRPINPDGTWGDKSRKIYKYDEQGNKIKKKNGRYDCTTEKTTDWDNKDNARKWRADLAETINAVNTRIGLDERWEHLSYEDRGLEIKPTLHLGEKNAALERQGIETGRGNYNREVRKYNAIVVRAKELAEAAIKELHKSVHKVEQKATAAVQKAKNEVLDFIDRVSATRGRMSLPIVGSKYFARIADREELEKTDIARHIVNTYGIKTFAQMDEYYKTGSTATEKYMRNTDSRIRRKATLEKLIKLYNDFAPSNNVKKEAAALTGIAKFKYEHEHRREIEAFSGLREPLVAAMKKAGEEKITPKKWQKELDGINAELPVRKQEADKRVVTLAALEVIKYTKKDLERIRQNEERAVARQAQRMAQPIRPIRDGR